MRRILLKSLTFQVSSRIKLFAEFEVVQWSDE